VVDWASFDGGVEEGGGGASTAPQDSVLSKFTGTVEVDEAYTGGKERHPQGSRKTGRIANEKKVPVIALVERHGRVRTVVACRANDPRSRPSRSALRKPCNDCCK
jgi:hypothetical protein